MLAYIPPLEETEIGKELIAIGYARGYAKGRIKSLKSQIAAYQALAQQGVIPEKITLALIEGLRGQLSESETELTGPRGKT